MAPSPYIFIISIGPVDMNEYARFDEIPSMTLKDIKETKRYGRTDGQRENSIPTHMFLYGEIVLRQQILQLHSSVFIF